MTLFLRALLLGLALGGADYASAQSLVVVVNPGFELDHVDDGQFTAPLTPQGWSAYDPTGVLDRDYSDVGVLNPTDTALYPAGAPQGSNVALVFLWPQSGADHNQPVGLQQMLSATLQPATQYSLTVRVGNIANNGPAPFDLAGFPGYSVQFLAGSTFSSATLLAQDNNTLSPADGTFALSTVNFTTGASHAELNQPLIIRLLNLNAPGSGIEVNFDDVQLHATAMPEPTTLAALLGGGALAAAAMKRHRARQHLRG